MYELDLKKEIKDIFKFCVVIAITSFFYRCYLFDTLPGLDVNDSISVFFWVSWTGAWLGYFLTPPRVRTAFSNLINSMLGLGVYTYAVYSRYFASLKIVLPVVIGALLILLVILTVTEHGRTRRKLKTVFFGGKTVIAFCLAMTVTVMGVFAWQTGGLIKSPENAALLENVGEEELEATVIEEIAPENWDKLDTEERLSVLHRVVCAEAKALGLETTPELLAGVATQNALAHYSDHYRSIVVDLEYLSETTGEKAVFVILHEMRHYYQHEVVRAFEKIPGEYASLDMFEEARKFKYAVDNYQKLDYNTNPIEVDANKYAEMNQYRYIKYGN